MIKMEHVEAGRAAVAVLHEVAGMLELVTSAVCEDVKASELPPHAEMLQTALGDLTAAIDGFELGFNPPRQIKIFCGGRFREAEQPWRPYMIGTPPKGYDND